MATPKNKYRNILIVGLLPRIGMNMAKVEAQLRCHLTEEMNPPEISGMQALRRVGSKPRVFAGGHSGHGIGRAPRRAIVEGSHAQSHSVRPRPRSGPLRFPARLS